ncbi:BrnT family toxin [Siccirubricoccus sp. KC 17139]|uniref:BrnT family toxin n=1 Tax=Siccirubricoccus soli TaxID=2899147 RepID=A0ABT1D6U3_9PROT|nr:BrnT family toxin [Siccirubricoccus soli]MCO6417657.1 BrnT family toxin [Siccirubricoccus soli]MCP2683792.1 BrnT family toxin [Siccirubricoccus soli]
MEFIWDEAKRESNIAKHGFDFLDIWQLFAGEYLYGAANPGPGGEERFLATGLVNGLCATAICTMRGETIRVISLRRARRNERERYQALFGG